MLDLTVNQTEILYDLTEIHLEWHQKYYNTHPTFAELLDENPKEVTKVLFNMKKNYLELLKKEHS
jgi:hypothetical protein